MLGAISDRVCVAQDKTESGIILSRSFSIMLIFKNNSPMSLHRLIFSWKGYYFKLFFRSMEQSSSANKKEAVVLQRRQGSSSSYEKKPQTEAVKSRVPIITNPFFSQMCEVCRFMLWKMSKLLWKHSINEKLPALPVPLSTELPQEESLSAHVARGKEGKSNPARSSLQLQMILCTDSAK